MKLNTKVKYIFPVLLVGLALLVYSSGAVAVSYIHGNFGASTNACRACHMVHVAPAKSLLAAGPSQTQFCFLCHGNGASGSPYDVQRGLIVGTEVSSAGGFDSHGGVAITSRHMVDGYTDNTSGFETGSSAYGFRGLIPGSSNAIIGSGLVCSSCHNPHAGGDDAPNPRLLRTVIMEVYDLFVEVDEVSVGIPNGFEATQVAGYRSGFNNWCSSCHDLLARPAGSGRTPDVRGLYRHATDVTATVYSVYNTTIAPGIPLEGAIFEEEISTGKVTCMTCHRSHGSTSQVPENFPGFRRLREAGGVAETVYSSVLLRMDNRLVCYTCHGAASRNKPAAE